MLHTPRREFKRMENIASPRSYSKPSPLPLPPPPQKANMSFNNDERKNTPPPKAKVDEEKLATLRAYRRAKGLCFKCGERWGHNHKCNTAVPLHLVEEMWALVQEEEVMQATLESEPVGNMEDTETLMAISRQAVQGCEGKRTVRLKGDIHCQEVLMLVDSGSSSSFISSHLMGLFPTVQKLNTPLRVKVSDGGVLSCQYEIPQCTWVCQGHTFQTDLKVLPLACYDIILGMDWLEMHSPMEMDWAKKCMAFQHKG